MPDLLLGDAPIEDEPRRRPRWVDAAGLVAVVAVILTVGVLGDPGEGTSSAPTTTTSRPPRRVPYDRLTTTTIGPTTTTGPVVLGRIVEPETDTVLLMEGIFGTQLLDVDTGTVRRVPRSYSGGAVLAAGGGFVTSDGDGSGLVFLPSDAGDTRPLAESAGGWLQPVGGTATSVWVGSEGAAIELALDGQPTGRRHVVPPSAHFVGMVDGGLVIEQSGSITLLDVGDGSTRSLGHGQIVGAAGRTVARVSCELLACRFELVDAVTGGSRAIRGAPSDGFPNDRGRFSPDGRWFAYSWVQADRMPELVLVDLRRGRATVLGTTSYGAFDFSVTGGLLFAATAGTLSSYDLAAGTWTAVASVDVSRVERVYAAHSP